MTIATVDLAPVAVPEISHGCTLGLSRYRTHGLRTGSPTLQVVQSSTPSPAWLALDFGRYAVVSILCDGVAARPPVRITAGLPERELEACSKDARESVQVEKHLHILSVVTRRLMASRCKLHWWGRLPGGWVSSELIGGQ